MTGQPDLLAELRRWVEKAEHDLQNAEYVLTLGDDCPTDTVCFHCQQCAEKYLKAVLVYRGAAFPKTHDLVVLLNRLGGASDLGLQSGQVQVLNRYSVEARYPGEWEPIDLAEARQAVAIAKSIRNAARGALPGDALPIKD
jgi:HEPN domain-containing protein